jgi:threonine dehydrogenase-like Zn-dependent dehydrogenase
VATLSEHAFAEYDVVAVDQLVGLPDEGLEVAPLEPFGCVFNVVDRADIAADQTVAVIGLGFVGLGVARLAAQGGARVLVVSSRHRALSLAGELGAQAGLRLDDRHRVAGQIAELTGGRGCDRVVECTGHQTPLDLAGDVVSEGGRLAIAGFHQDGPRQVDLQQWNWKGIDVVNAHERDPARIRRGMELAADAIARDPVWTTALVTRRFALAEIGSALAQAADRPPGFVKGAVLMEAASC